MPAPGGGAAAAAEEDRRGVRGRHLEAQRVRHGGRDRARLLHSSQVSQQFISSCDHVLPLVTNQKSCHDTTVIM